MRTRALLVVFVFSAASVFASSTDAAGDRNNAQEIVKRALATIADEGALQRLSHIKTTEHRVTYHIQEANHWEPPYLPDYLEATEWLDVRSRAAHTEMTMALATADKQTVTRVARDGFALNHRSYNGNALPDSVSVDNGRWQLQNPLLVLLRASQAPDLHLLPVATLFHAPHVRVAFAAGDYRVTLWMDARNDHLDATDISGSDRRDMFWNMWGDVLQRVVYSFWWYDPGGIHYPHQWHIYFNDQLQEEHSIDTVAANPDVNSIDFAVPEERRGQAVSRLVDDFPFGNPQKPISEIAPGVVQIPGSWYVTLVRQPDGIVVIDAPISNGYSRKVIEECGKRFPGQPIKAVVTTTSFWWHVAGVREYAARGIPIYAVDDNAPSIRKLLLAPHTLAPDALQSAGAGNIRVTAVEKETALGAANRLVLYPIRRSTTPMLMVWMPEHRVLHTGEMVQPLGPGGSLLFPESLLEVKRSADAEQLDVNTMIGMHMSPTPWQKLIDALAEAEHKPSS